jgi:hypothetical protein
MLALLLSVFVNVSGYGQSYTPIDYRFANPNHTTSKRDPDSNIYGIRNRNNTVLSNSFISAASNGYGTWTVNSDGYWFLMSNEFDYGSSDSYDAARVVSMGAVTLGDGLKEIKVATNLKGSVRFVYPNQARDGFLIKALNDANVLGTPSIDISFTGIPKDVDSREAVKNAGQTVTASTQVGNVFKTISNSGNQADLYWQDISDVAMDEEFTYIVWQHYNNLSTKFEIWVTVVNNHTNLTVTGFPKPVTDPQNNETGRRPTIACNVRHNSGATPFSNPTFDIAYITDIPNPGQPGGGQIIHAFFTNNNFVKTPQPLWVKKSSAGGRLPYSLPMHVRMLVSSAIGQVTPVKAIYAIVDPGTTGQTKGDLIFHKILNNTNVTPNPLPHAYYVDGANTFLQAHQAPLNTLPVNEDDFMIENDPINGFANPYDGEPNDNYDEFHCLYSFDFSYSISRDPNPPFQFISSAAMIVRGCNNKLFSNKDTRTILNRRRAAGNNTWVWTLTPTSQTLIGGVNQMGIHTYWRADGQIQNYEYYSRDFRDFDEDIEENTLVSYDCFVANGSTHLGSATGPTLLPNRTMTLWEDMYSAVDGSVPSHGIYVSSSGISGPTQLTFVNNDADGDNDDNVKLTIGLNNESGLGSTFITLPNYGIKFSYPTQKLIVNQASNYICYGFEQPQLSGVDYETEQVDLMCGLRGGGSIEFYGGSATITGGTNGFPSSLTRPATLTIHPGAELRLSEECTFSAEHAQINILYGASIYPPYSPPTTNPSACGKFTTHGKLTLNECIVNSNIADALEFDIIHVKPCLLTTSCSTSVNQVSLTNTLIENTVVGGLGIVRCTDYYYKDVNGAPDLYFRNQRPSEISGGKYISSRIFVENPEVSFSIHNAKFDKLIGSAIWFKRTTTNSYDELAVSSNEFLSTGKGSSSWIKFEGFDLHHIITTFGTDPETGQPTYDQTNRILILDNLWQTARGSSHTGITAIHMLNSAAGIAGNSISGVGYKYGIFQEYDGFSTIRRSTFICKNTIANCSESGNGAGIKTENWLGYIKDCEILNCDVGILSNHRDEGGVVFSYIHNNLLPGLKLVGNTSVLTRIDIRGVVPLYPVSGSPYAAVNTFEINNRNTDGTAGSTGQLEISDNALLLMGKWDSPYDNVTNHSKNNVILNGPNDNFIFKLGTPSVSLGNSNIDRNYWEDGDGNVIDPSSNSSLFENVTFTSAANSGTVEEFEHGSVACSGGIPSPAGIIPKEQTPQSVLIDTTCDYKRGIAYNLTHGGKYQEGYEAYQQYFEYCALEPNSRFEFGGIGSANGYRNDKVERFSEFREWLKKVLYYNPDERYYCADVGEILGTFEWFDSVRGHDRLGAIAIAQYLLDSKKCADSLNVEFLKEGIEDEYRLHYEKWRDTVQDSLKTPLDTTLPSLEDLGLGILRGNPNSVVSPASLEERIAELIATRNPFTDILELKYRLDKSAMVRIDVYDLLGRAVYSEGQGYKAEGEHLLSLQSKAWASGSYYVRLSSPSGEVKSVKVVKE